MVVNILELFSKEELMSFKERPDGSWTGKCPSCGRGDGYGGCIIDPTRNTLHCFGSRTTFDFLETVALIDGIISCEEGGQ